MKLKELTISERASYESNPGRYVAKIKYEGQYGALELVLDPAVSEDLLQHLGETITAYANSAAEKVKQGLMESVASSRALNLSTPLEITDAP